MSSSSFLVHSQSFRTNFKSDNFSELILSNYCCLIIQHMEFLFEKTFAIFDIEYKIIKVQPESDVCLVLKQRLFQK